jgi:hypothetical protein
MPNEDKIFERTETVDMPWTGVVMTGTLLLVLVSAHVSAHEDKFSNVPGCHACLPGQQCCGPTSYSPSCYWPQNETCCASVDSLVTICHGGDSCCPTWGPPQMFHCCSNSTKCCGGGGADQYGACCTRDKVCCAGGASVCCPERQGCGAEQSTCGHPGNV